MRSIQTIPASSALSYPCQKCGRPRPLTLAPRTLPCPACHDASAPPAEVARAIDAARTAMFNLPLRARQLGAAEKLALSLEGSNRVARRLWAFFAVMLFLLALAGSIAFSVGDLHDPAARESFWFGLAGMLPFFLHCVLGWLLRKRRIAFRDEGRHELEARPGVDGGFVCRVCGAPIETKDLEAPFIVCSYCKAHNVRGSQDSTSGAARELVSYENLQATIIANRTRARPLAGLATFLALFAAPLLAALGIVAAFAIDAHMAEKKGPLNESRKYFVTWNPKRPAGERTLCIYDADELTNQRTLAEHSLGEIRPGAATELVGSYAGLGPMAGARIVGVSADGWGTNVFDGEGGGRQAIDSTCADQNKPAWKN